MIRATAREGLLDCSRPQVEMIDQRIAEHLTHLNRVDQLGAVLRDIYLQGFADCYTAITTNKQGG